MKVNEMLAENRPRERLQHVGPTALSTAELLAIILKSGTRKHNVLELSEILLAKYGLTQLANLSITQLQKEYGIGPAKACQIAALFEINKRLPQKAQTKPIRQARDIANIYLPKFKDKTKEHFVAIYLDTKNKIIKHETITIGILNASLVHPREVFHGAIKHCAKSLIILHNHPSGDITPSKEDLEVTRRLQKTGEIMDIPLLDHIIIGNNNYWSWKESNFDFSLRH